MEANFTVTEDSYTPSISSNLISIASNDPLPSTSKNSSFAAFLDNLDPVHSAPLKLETEMTLYEHQPRLILSSSVLDFWNLQTNSLADIANTVLSAPSTEVSVERNFSALKYIFSDKRNRLLGENIENLLIVSLNGEFKYE